MSKDSKEIILKKIRAVEESWIDHPDFFPSQEVVCLNDDLFSDIPEDLFTAFKENAGNVGAEVFLFKNDEEAALFAENLFIEQGIEEVYCQNRIILGFFKKTQVVFQPNFSMLEGKKAGISNADFFIARTGSVLAIANKPSEQKMFAFPDLHIVWGYTRQLCKDISDGLNSTFSNISSMLPFMTALITGPSRTADIEKTLVMGAHGPEKLVILLIQSH